MSYEALDEIQRIFDDANTLLQRYKVKADLDAFEFKKFKGFWRIHYNGKPFDQLNIPEKLSASGQLPDFVNHVIETFEANLDGAEEAATDLRRKMDILYKEHDL